MNKVQMVLATILCSVFCIGQTAPIMTIVPDKTQVTLNVTGTAMVNYTVTNATLAANLVGLTLYPTQGGGFPSNITLMNDTCTGSSLAPAASCTFALQLSGQGLKDNFALSPQVCANNNTACSQPISANRTEVTLSTQTTPAIAYLPLVDNTVLPINDETLTPETAITGFNFAVPLVGISLSADGNTMYVPDQVHSALDIVDLKNSDSITSVTVFCPPLVTAPQPHSSLVYVGCEGGGVVVVDTQTLTITTFPASFAIVYAITFTPDGSIVYINDFVPATPPAVTANVSAFLTSTSAPINAFTNIPGDFDITNQVVILPFVVASPNNLNVYINDANDNELLVCDTSLIPGTPIPMPAGATTPTALTIDQTGTLMYVATGGTSGEGSLLVLDLSAVPPVTITIIDRLGLGLGLSASLSLDPSGSNLYYPVFGMTDLFVVDTSNFSITSLTLPVPTINLGVNPYVR